MADAMPLMLAVVVGIVGVGVDVAFAAADAFD